MKFPAKYKLLNTKYLKKGIALLLIIIVIGGISLKYFVHSSDAAWFDDSFAYRTPITFTNSGSEVTYQKVKFDVDTATLISAGKMQSDCGDSRFTNANGKVLRYYLDSAGGACNTSSTDYYVLLPVIPVGGNVVYHYYGNPNAANGTEIAQFSETTFSQTPSTGSEEKAPQPAAYWKFDEGTGTTVNDSTSNKNTGTLGASTADPTWQTEDMCISGKCLYFDGSNDYVQTTPISSLTTNFSVGMWVRPTVSGSWQTLYQSGTATNYWRINIDSNNKFDFTKNAVADYASTTAIIPNQWNYLEVVKSGDSGTNLTFYINGTVAGTASVGSVVTPSGTAYIGATGAPLLGFMDEFKIYPYARSAAQVKADYNSRGSVLGASSSLGASQGSTLSNGLVGYWKMDESSGNLTDSSGNSNTGTVSGTSIVGGVFGNGRSFTGSSYADITMNQTFQQTTVCTWLKTSTTTGYIYTQNNVGNTANLGFLVTAAGKLSLGIWNGTTIPEATSTTTITSGTWIHGCAVRNGGEFKIYINGSLESSITNGNTNNIGTLASIGRNRVTNDTYYNGQLDEMRIYNRALSPDEVSTLYNFAPGPVGYWKMDEKSGSSAADSSGNGLTGTLTNGPKWGQGKVGDSTVFDGTDDYIDLGTSSTLVLNTFSVSAWVKTTSTNAQEIFAKKSRSYGGWNAYSLIIGPYVASSTAGQISARIQQSSTPTFIDFKTTQTVNDGQWHYITLTYGSDFVGRIYIDGVLAATSTSGTNIYYANQTQHAFIGAGRYCSTPATDCADNTVENSFNGALDEVKLYNYARSQKQIAEDMMAGHPAVAGARSGSMVGYWKMDEGTGTLAKDSSGNGNNGTLTNMATAPSTSTSGWSNFGKFNKALNFDGSNDYISVANSSSLNLTGTMAFSAWVYATAIPSGSSYAFIGKKSDGSNHQYALLLDGPDCSSTSKFTFVIWVGGIPKAVCATNTTPQANTWYYVVGTYDGSYLRIYINGKLDNTIAQTGSIGTGTGTFKIGTNISDLYWPGKIDEVKIYGSALTAEEIKTDYNRSASQQFGSTGTSAAGVNDNSSERSYCPPGDTTANCSPVGEWNFEEGSGTTLRDTSVNGLDGTATSTSFVPGKVGKGVQFTGNDSYVNLGTSSLLNITGTKTVEAWVKVDSSDTTNTYRRIFSKREGLGSNETTGYELLINPSSCGVIFNHVSINPTATATATGCRGNWVHIAGVYTGTQGIVYINGVPGTASTFSSAVSNSSPALIGTCGSEYNNGASGCDFKGQIDQVKVYNYTRTGAQIAWDYNRGAPIAYWKMDECQGASVYDSSGNGNTGTITIGSSGSQTSTTNMGSCAASSTTPRYNGRVGKYNSSINLDGTDDYITAGSSTSLDISSEITVAAWIKPASIAQYDSIASRITTPAYTGWSFFLGPSSNLQFTVNDNTAHMSSSANSVTTGSWQHVAITYKTSGAYTFYVNGKSVGTGSYPSAITDSGRTMVIGRYYENYSGYYFDGQIDDVRLYKYALTSTQIKDLYNGGAVRFGPLTGTP